MNELQKYLEAIKQEKDTKVLAENIRKGVTAFGVSGTYEQVENIYGIAEFVSAIPTHATYGTSFDDYFVYEDFVMVHFKSQSITENSILKIENGVYKWLCDIDFSQYISDTLSYFGCIVNRVGDVLTIVKYVGKTTSSKKHIFKYNFVDGFIVYEGIKEISWWTRQPVFAYDGKLLGVGDSEQWTIMDLVNNTSLGFYPAKNSKYTTQPWYYLLNPYFPAFSYSDGAYFEVNGAETLRSYSGYSLVIAVLNDNKIVLQKQGDNSIHMFTLLDGYELGVELDADLSEIKPSTRLMTLNDKYLIEIANYKLWEYNAEENSIKGVATFSSPKLANGGISVSGQIYHFIKGNEVIGHKLDGNIYYAKNPVLTKSDKILSGYQTRNEDFSVVTGTMNNVGSQVIKPTSSNIKITNGYHNGSGYVEGDANLVASNIRADKTIFGVTGTAPITFSTIEEMDANIDFPENTFAIVYGTTYMGTFRLDNGTWTQIGDSTEEQLIMDTLNDIADTTDEYEGVGGTDEELSAVLDQILEGGSE